MDDEDEMKRLRQSKQYQNQRSGWNNSEQYYKNDGDDNHNYSEEMGN